MYSSKYPSISRSPNLSLNNGKWVIVTGILSFGGPIFTVWLPDAVKSMGNNMRRSQSFARLLGIAWPILWTRVFIAVSIQRNIIYR